MNLDKINIEIKKRILELKEIIYTKYNGVGGELHIVLDDHNTEDYYINWCINNCINKIEDNKERQIYLECAKLLLKLSNSKRLRLLKEGK